MTEIILLILFGAGFVWWSWQLLFVRDRERAANRTPSDQAQRQVDQEAQYPQRGADSIYRYGRDNVPGDLYNQRQIMAAAGLAEQRRHGRNVRGGPVIVAEIPEDDKRLDYDVRVSQRWLRREGPKSDIHLVDN